MRSEGITATPRRRFSMSALLCVLVAALLVGGCNTIRGFGKDLSKVGDEIEDAATR